MKTNQECEPVINAAKEAVQDGSKEPKLKVIVFLAKLRDKLIKDNFRLRSKVREQEEDR